MKKTVILVMALALLMGITGSAWAKEAAPSTAAVKNAQRYAYMNPQTAPDELKEKIIESRNAIINSSEWVADGYSASVVDMETGEVIREIPSFSSVFPSDWSLPVIDESATAPALVDPQYVSPDAEVEIPGWNILEPDLFTPAATSAIPSRTVFNGSVYLTAPPLCRNCRSKP